MRVYNLFLFLLLSSAGNCVYGIEVTLTNALNVIPKLFTRKIVCATISHIRVLSNILIRRAINTDFIKS